MRFLDHIPTKKVIMEAGIADVGVVLDRLAQEIQGVCERNDQKDFLHIVPHVQQAKQLIMAAADRRTANNAGAVGWNYERAMWLAKSIRTLMIAKCAYHYRGCDLPEDGPVADPAWAKFATRALKQAGQTLKRTYVFAGHSVMTDPTALFNSFKHFVDMAGVSPTVAAVPWSGEIGTVMDALRAAEQQWKVELEEKKKDIEVNNVDRVIITDEQMGLPGWFWVYLERGKCPEEAKAMGHCGTESGSHLISLRNVTEYDENGKPKMWRPWATASYKPEEKLIGQLKGPHNSKPAIDKPGESKSVLQRNRTVRKAISHLFHWAEIKGFRASGFGGGADFRPGDLDQEDFDALPDNPGLFATDLKSWSKKYGSEPESLAKYFQHTSTPISKQQFYDLSKETRDQVIKVAQPEVLRNIDFISFVDALGPTRLAVERYTKSHVNLLNDDLQILIDAGNDDALTAAWELSPVSFRFDQFAELAARKGVDAEKAIIAFYERSPKLITPDEFNKFPEELQRVVIERGPARACANLPLSAFITYLGQTGEMVQRYFNSHPNVHIGSLIKSLNGKALAFAWEHWPQYFVLEDFLRLKKYKPGGKLDGTGPELVDEFIKARGEKQSSSDYRRGQITSHDYPGLQMLSKKDLRAYLEDGDDEGEVNDHHTLDIFFQAYGISDESIEKLLRALKPDQFTGRIAYEQTEDNDINVAIMTYLLKNDPNQAAEAVSMHWDPKIGPDGLFVYRTFNDIQDCVDTCQDKHRRDNGIEYAMEVSVGQKDLDSGDYYWRDAEEALEAVLDQKELDMLPEYVRQKYPEAIEDREIDPEDLDVSDAISILDNEGDHIIDCAKDAASDGDRSGAEGAYIKALRSAIKHSKLSVAGFQLELYFDGQKGWSHDLQYDTKCVVGFRPKDFAKLVTHPNNLGEVLKDLYDGNYEYEDGFYMDSDRDYSVEFDESSARENFYNDSPQEFDALVKDIRKEVDAKLRAQDEARRKRGLDESLSARLKW